MARGGYRPGAGRKPNPDRPRIVATTKLPQRRPLAVPAEPKAEPQAMDVNALVAALPQIEEMLKRYQPRKERREQPRSQENSPFKLPWFPTAARPRTGAMAMDNMPIFADAGNAWVGAGGYAAEGLVFLGYPYLAELAQRPEYRTMAETIADDATREWLSFDVTGDEGKEREERNKDPEGFEERQQDPDEMKKRVKAAGKEDKVKAIVDDQERLEVRDRFYWASTFDSYMGRSHLYLQIGDTDFERVQGEMAASIGNGRDEMSRTKVTKETPLRYIKTVEPMWTYPQAYNAQNPLSPDWYNPQQFYVMGREINVSRLQTFISRPVPDMLKPAYAFGGLPLSQIAKPYVDIWLDTRQSVADLIKSFSVMVLQTDLAVQTAPGNATALLARVLLFNMMRDNQGLFVTNKNTEDFKNVSAPISGLHELQAQAQEHMLSVSRIPAVKFTGIQPSGLNASSDGEIKVYDDTIKAYQKRTFDPNLTRIINFQMLSLFGEVDPEITHRWNPLRQLTDAEKAEQKKKEADWFNVLVEMGSFSPGEVRRVVIEDPESPFAGLNPDDVPPPPAQPGMPGEGEEGEEPPADGQEEEGEFAAGGPGGAQDRDPFGGTRKLRFHDVPLIADDEWNEDDHPRGEGGKFTSGAGGGSSSSTKPEKKHGGMPDIPAFLKRHGNAGSGSPSKWGVGGQTLKMPQFGLTSTPSSWSYKPRPFPKSSGKPGSASSVVVFSQGAESDAKKLNGKAFKRWEPPADWAGVSGQAEIDEPELPKLPKGMTMSSGVLIREPDGRVWMVRPTGGYGGYDQTFPKGGLEEGLSPQANAIKEAYEESGLKVKITGFAGDYEGDSSVTRFYMAERETGDPRDAGWESEGVVLAPVDKLKDFLNRRRDRDIAKALAGEQKAEPEAASGTSAAVELDPDKLKKQGGKLGSNEGGTFTDEQGNKFYIKRPASKAHVANELAAARLYQLAGVQTLDYLPVKGGNHVATKWESLDKNRISQMSEQERSDATRDFAVHAWLSNWDAAGTGGDNQGVRNGQPVTLDVGGSLRYRAQGGEKGKAFGPKVTEIDTMRDSSKSYDAGKLFGKMTDEQLADSVRRVASIPDEKIRAAVGDDKDLADTLIARKKDLADRFEVKAADEALMLAADEANWEESKHPRGPDGKFTSGAGGGAFKANSVSHLKHMLDKMFLNDDLTAAHQAWHDNPALQEEFKQQHPDVVSETPFMQSGGEVKSGEVKPTKFPKLGHTTAEGKQSAFGGLYVTTGMDDKANHDLTVKKALQGGGKGGTHFRNLLKQLILDSEKFNTKAAIPALKAKLGWAWAQAAQKAQAKGDAKGAAKALAKAAEYGHGPAKFAQAEAAQLKAAQPQKVEIKTPEPAKPAATSLEGVAKAIGKTTPTPAEIEKAKKSVALQMSYVPGPKPEMASGAPAKAAEKLIAEFNAKWSGKSGLSQGQLVDKVHDFKALQAGMMGLAAEEKKHYATIAANAKAEQAAQAKKQAEKAAAEAKANAEKNKELMDELGIGQDQAEGLNALAKMLGQSNSDLVQAFKAHEAKAKGYGYPISGIEAATIMSYSDGSYGKVNEALRSGKWSPAQHVYVSMVNKALAKMPKHTGSEAKGDHLIRNTHLTAEQIAEYAEGHIVQEKALMSTSTKKPNGVFSGNVRFLITSKGKRGASIKKLSHFGSEDEVIFQAKTFFKVNKVEKLTSKLSSGADTVIHLEEWEDL